MELGLHGAGDLTTTISQSGHYWWCGCIGELSHDGQGGHDGPSFSTLVESSVPQLITLDPMDAMETMESILVDLMTIASPRWWRAGMVSWSYGLIGTSR